MTPLGNYEEVFNKEFVEGTEIVFSGKVYKMNETLVEIDPVFSRLAQTIHLFVLSAPDFTIKSASE